MSDERRQPQASNDRPEHEASDLSRSLEQGNGTPAGAAEDGAARPPARRGLMRSGLVVSSMTMVSRVLGLVRDVVIATLLGAGQGADAFFVAFKIPNFMRRLFAEGAFNQAFVPVLSE